MSNYFNRHGLINAKLIEDVSENCSLFTLEYILLKKNHDEDFLSLLYYLLIYIKKCKTHITGLYNQLPEIHYNKDDYMSPDQLIAFTGAFYLSGRNVELKQIWDYLKDHKYTYDNISGEVNFDRIMQPMAISFVAVLNRKYQWYPMLLVSILVSVLTKKGKSSGKLKAYVCLNVLNLKILTKICGKILNGFKDWDAVFLEYFKEESHPIRTFIKSRQQWPEEQE